jgi:Flp pilus assembly pilin Flp
MASWSDLPARLVRDDRGQDLIEYGLLLSLITVAVITAVNGIGCKVSLYFSNTNDALP